MSNYELEVYTSAQKLLEDSGSDLGIIAKTRDFPAVVGRTLSSMRYYTFLDEISLERPELHPPRIVAGPLGVDTHFSINLAMYFGPDYTGRTTPTVFSATAHTKNLGLENLFVPQFLKSIKEIAIQWTGDPRIIDPKPLIREDSLASMMLQSQVWSKYQSSDLVRQMYSFVLDALISFEETGRAVVFVVPVEDSVDVLALLIDILCLLPRSIQLTRIFATHVLSNTDFPRGAALGFTYPDSEFLKHSMARHDPKRPFVVDVVHGTGFVATKVASYGFLVSETVFSNQNSLAEKYINDWDTLGFSSKLPLAFAQFEAFSQLLRTQMSCEPSDESIKAIDKEFGRLQEMPERAAKHLEHALYKGIDEISSSSTSTKCESLVAAIVADYFPLGVKKRAAECLAMSFESIRPDLLSMELQKKLPVSLAKQLVQSMQATPKPFLLQSIEAVKSHPKSSFCLELASRLLDSSCFAAPQIFQLFTETKKCQIPKELSILFADKFVQRCAVNELETIVGPEGPEMDNRFVNVWELTESKNGSTSSLRKSLISFGANLPTASCLEKIAELLKPVMIANPAFESHLVSLGSNSRQKDWIKDRFQYLFCDTKPAANMTNQQSSAERFLPFRNQVVRSSVLHAPRTMDIWRRCTMPWAWIIASISACTFSIVICYRYSWDLTKLLQPKQSAVIVSMIVMSCTAFITFRWLNKNPNTISISVFLLQNLVFFFGLILTLGSVIVATLQFRRISPPPPWLYWIEMFF